MKNNQRGMVLGEIEGMKTKEIDGMRIINEVSFKIDGEVIDIDNANILVKSDKTDSQGKVYTLEIDKEDLLNKLNEKLSDTRTS